MEASRHYSPAEYTGSEKRVISGNRDEKFISTSYVERQNLTMRMGMRWFTRLTNGFSKKVENVACAVSLHFLHYNFVRVHQSLKGRTPAMALASRTAAGQSKTSCSWSRPKRPGGNSQNLN